MDNRKIMIVALATAFLLGDAEAVWRANRKAKNIMSENKVLKMKLKAAAKFIQDEGDIGSKQAALKLINDLEFIDVGSKEMLPTKRES